MSTGIPAKSKKTELLALPSFEWGEEQPWYRSLLIVPTRMKHDSGFAQVAVIGVNEATEAEKILAYPDDIQFPVNPDEWSLRMDCYHPTLVLHLWSLRFEFSVDYPTSSVCIKTRPYKREG